MGIKVLNYITRLGDYEPVPGDSICNCCGSRIAGDAQVEEYHEDEDGYEIYTEVSAKFEDYKKGIIIQFGEHGTPGDDGRAEITHVKTSNGIISVKAEYAW